MTTKTTETTTETGSQGQEAIRDLEEVLAEIRPKKMLYIVGSPDANAHLEQYRMAHKAMGLAEKAGIALELGITLYPSDYAREMGRVTGDEYRKTRKEREDALKQQIANGAYDLVVIAESCICCVGYPDDSEWATGSPDANVIRYAAKAKPGAAYIMIPSGEHEEINAHEAKSGGREFMRPMLVK